MRIGGVGRTYKYGAATKTTLENLAIPTFDEPEDLDANATRMTVKIWERDVEEYVKKWNTTIQENLKTAFLLIYRQCSEELRAKLKSRPDHAEVEAVSNSLGLLQNIRTVIFQFQSQRYGPLALQ